MATFRRWVDTLGCHCAPSILGLQGVASGFGFANSEVSVFS
jgi:hypothetical protein